MKTLFIAAGPIEWGSSRMRAYWVAEEMKNAGVIQNGDNVGIPAGYDAYIWQKAVNLDGVKGLGGKHYWDVCDPSWWWQPELCREIAQHMTAVVASSEALAADFNEWYSEDVAICIPDRLKLSHFHTQRQHADVSPVRFIWFGVSVNRIALYGALANLERLVANGHKIELTIFDDRPDVPFRISSAFPIYHLKWELDKEVDVLSSHDIALLPPYPGAWGRVKSDNKTLTAWACGLPVCSYPIPDTPNEDYSYMEHLVKSHHYRHEMGWDGGMDYLETEWGVSVNRSARQWEALLS